MEQHRDGVEAAIEDDQLGPCFIRTFTHGRVVRLSWQTTHRVGFGERNIFPDSADTLETRKRKRRHVEQNRPWTHRASFAGTARASPICRPPWKRKKKVKVQPRADQHNSGLQQADIFRAGDGGGIIGTCCQGCCGAETRVGTAAVPTPSRFALNWVWSCFKMGLFFWCVPTPFLLALRLWLLFTTNKHVFEHFGWGAIARLPPCLRSWPPVCGPDHATPLSQVLVGNRVLRRKNAWRS